MPSLVTLSMKPVFLVHYNKYIIPNEWMLYRLMNNHKNSYLPICGYIYYVLYKHMFIQTNENIIFT